MRHMQQTYSSLNFTNISFKETLILKYIFVLSYFLCLVAEMGFLCVALVVWELVLLDHTGFELKKSTCLCTPHAGIKGVPSQPALWSTFSLNQYLSTNYFARKLQIMMIENLTKQIQISTPRKRDKRHKIYTI